MTSFGLYNVKGGVGKTTAAINLSFLASMEGGKTLVWDLDPQGAATYCLGSEPDLDVDLEKVFSGKEDFGAVIVPTPFPNLDLIRSDLSLRTADLMLDGFKRSKKRIRDLLSGLGNRYRYAFLDSPPGLSLLSENIFHASDVLLVPVVPSTLSLRTHGIIERFFGTKGWDESRIVAFFSMADSRKKLHSKVMEEYSGGRDGFCRTIIAYRADIERMGIDRAPIVFRRPNSESSAAFQNLWKEIKEHGIVRAAEASSSGSSL